MTFFMLTNIQFCIRSHSPQNKSTSGGLNRNSLIRLRGEQVCVNILLLE